MIAPIYGRYAWIGVYVCHPDYRGTGCGMAVWEAAFRLLEERGIVDAGLDAVEAQTPRYQRSGFVSAWKSTRYSTTLATALPLHEDGSPVLTDLELTLSSSSCVKILPIFDSGPLSGELTHHCVQFDRKYIYPTVDRDDLIRRWVSLHPTFVCIEEEGEEKRCLGFGSYRSSTRGYRIGPLYASSLPVAIALVRSVLQDLKGKGVSLDTTIFLDVPAPNSLASQLFTPFSFSECFYLWRMYKGTPPQQDHIDMEFGILNWELTF